MPVNSRNSTKFSKTPTFIEIIDEYDNRVNATIVAHIMRFEVAWRNSKPDGDLPSGYCFELYSSEVDDQYRLGQIRLGPNHGYRAVAMFLNGYPEAYWEYAYKKVRDRQPQDMNRARDLARAHWDTMKRGNDESK